MALTRRGKTAIAGVVIVVIAGIAIVVLAFGKDSEFIRNPLGAVTGDSSPEAKPACPLTGMPAPGGEVPDRPVLAIKVENYPEARPQYGLDTADIVYEEPVEGGITRFIVVYQCDDAVRVEPIRSARTSDIAFLLQFGEPLFAYADAARYVQNAVEKEDAITDVNWKKVKKAYHTDASRDAPHNLYSSTDELYKAGLKRNDSGAPQPVFTYAEEFPDVRARKAKTVHLEFSSNYSDVFWKYRGGAYFRSHGNDKHTVADGGQVRADNVLVQVVKLKNTGRKDPAGNPVPEIVPTGSGKAYLFRDGKAILGTWTLDKGGGVTEFTTASGEEFVLKPGVTWVELYPKNAPKVER